MNWYLYSVKKGHYLVSLHSWKNGLFINGFCLSLSLLCLKRAISSLHTWIKSLAWFGGICHSMKPLPISNQTVRYSVGDLFPKLSDKKIWEFSALDDKESNRVEYAKGTAFKCCDFGVRSFRCVLLVVSYVFKNGYSHRRGESS